MGQPDYDFSGWEADPVLSHSTKVHSLYPAKDGNPLELHQRAAQEYAQWSELVRRGGHLMFPWSSVSSLVGPLMPGWLVLIGARAKGGKSTFLRSIFDSWVTDFKKRILYVGTEQNAGILKALWACLRCHLPESAADPLHPSNHLVVEDIKRQEALSDQAIIVAEQDITLETFTQWSRRAWKEKCDVVMFDHFHRLDDDGASQNRSRGRAIREIKNIASRSSMLFVCAAQLKNASEDALGEFEVPGAGSWAETAALRREADLAMQIWRPLKPGTTGQQKMEARNDPMKLSEIIQPNTMAIRCDAHRYPTDDTAPYKAARLVVKSGELMSWSALG